MIKGKRRKLHVGRCVQIFMMFWCFFLLLSVSFPYGEIWSWVLMGVELRLFVRCTFCVVRWKEGWWLRATMLRFRSLKEEAGAMLMLDFRFPLVVGYCCFWLSKWRCLFLVNLFSSEASNRGEEGRLVIFFIFFAWYIFLRCWVGYTFVHVFFFRNILIVFLSTYFWDWRGISVQRVNNWGYGSLWWLQGIGASIGPVPEATTSSATLRFLSWFYNSNAISEYTFSIRTW